LHPDGAHEFVTSPPYPEQVARASDETLILIESIDSIGDATSELIAKLLG
jgi:hypothetical protein